MKKIVSDQLERRAIIARNIDLFLNDCGFRVGEASVRMGIRRETVWNHRNEHEAPSLWNLSIYASFFRLHLVELIHSRDELLDMLSDLVCRYGIGIPNGTESTGIPDFDYARAISIRLLMERRRTGLKLKELEAELKKAVSYSALNRYESGKDPFPARLIVPVASAFGMTSLEFLTPPEYLYEVIGILARKYRALEDIGCDLVSA